MARPVGVTIISVCCFLAALYGAVNGIRLIARGFMATFRDAGVASGGAELGAVLILILIIFTALQFLAGWGLWKLRRWGYWIAIFLVAVGATFRSIRWFLTAHHKTSDFFETAITFAIYGVIVAYLLKENVKAAFAAS